MMKKSDTIAKPSRKRLRRKINIHSVYEKTVDVVDMDNFVKLIQLFLKNPVKRQVKKGDGNSRVDSVRRLNRIRSVV